LFPVKEIDRGRLSLTIAWASIGVGYGMNSQRTGFVAAVALAMFAGPSLAGGPGIYAYEGTANYCPAGLQPVSINGVICCGQPNRAESYQDAKSHPVARIRSARARYDECTPGTKACD
jgi:hypothetical protein